MKIFPLKPMSNYDRFKNLVKIMEYNQKLKMAQKADLNAFPPISLSKMQSKIIYTQYKKQSEKA